MLANLVYIQLDDGGWVLAKYLDSYVTADKEIVVVQIPNTSVKRHIARKIIPVTRVVSSIVKNTNQFVGSLVYFLKEEELLLGTLIAKNDDTFLLTKGSETYTATNVFPYHISDKKMRWFLCDTQQ